MYVKVRALAWSAVVCCTLSSAWWLAIHCFCIVLAPKGVSPSNLFLGFQGSGPSTKLILTAQVSADGIISSSLASLWARIVTPISVHWAGFLFFPSVWGHQSTKRPLPTNVCSEDNGLPHQEPALAPTIPEPMSFGVGGWRDRGSNTRSLQCSPIYVFSGTFLEGTNLCGDGLRNSLCIPLLFGPGSHLDLVNFVWGQFCIA